MSTFDGLVAEFPDIRVDFFRKHPDLRPPLACFLSHVHSDHLAGLESLRSPFVYCSAATREILLRLERYPCRINYAKGILEARVQTYKHLSKLMKPIPLETPTVLELEPGNHIQVALFDANHCPGAVMFLIEGQGKAVLYTGDIRSEPWFVNALARSPCLIEYTSGLKTLDTIYLDTSFTESVSFQTKAEGLRELVRKVVRYPSDTIFHFQAWTYGYEDVWVTLAKALKSKVHVDKYKMSIYNSLLTPVKAPPKQPTRNPAKEVDREFHLSPEAPPLVGFPFANSRHDGCLTLDHHVRLHSCEKGNYCETVKNSQVVWIQPIVARLPDGQAMAEMGVGGGADDFQRDAELDYLSPEDIQSLLEILCDSDDLSDELKEAIRCQMIESVASGRKMTLDLDMSKFGDNNEVALQQALQAIANKAQFDIRKVSAEPGLPNTITFPYSRHSSYPELCDLVNIFKPRDVWPCTVHRSEWLREGKTIEGMFGQYCPGGELLRHDKLMEEYAKMHPPENVDEDTQMTNVSFGTSISNDIASSCQVLGQQIVTDMRETVPESRGISPRASQEVDEAGTIQPPFDGDEITEDPAIAYVQGSQESQLSEYALDIRLHAFRAMLDNTRNNAGHEIGLLSTRDHHTELDMDLGEHGPQS
ncbi:beta-lactamase-like protein [Rhypophila decipiens]|uniref:Beta-lactamase-like protein n=1 Tax=Rhypophila decipiens TaxID=261697 RepID=A0AAN7BDZ7_9PEZI|nr:beta-lactamase-like protein [Rhypophila decipiens]